jgi:hypothetical protein
MRKVVQQPVRCWRGATPSSNTLNELVEDANQPRNGDVPYIRAILITTVVWDFSRRGRTFAKGGERRGKEEEGKVEEAGGEGGGQKPPRGRGRRMVFPFPSLWEGRRRKGRERGGRKFSLAEEGKGSFGSVFPWGNGGICLSLNPIPIPLLCNVHPI